MHLVQFIRSSQVRFETKEIFYLHTRNGTDSCILTASSSYSASIEASPFATFGIPSLAAAATVDGLICGLVLFAISNSCAPPPVSSCRVTSVLACSRKWVDRCLKSVPNFSKKVSLSEVLEEEGKFIASIYVLNFQWLAVNHCVYTFS